MNWSTRLRRWVRMRTPPVLRRLDEADRGDGLAGAGGVLEPEAAGGAGVLGRLLDRLLVLLGRHLPVLRLLVGGQLLVHLEHRLLVFEHRVLVLLLQVLVELGSGTVGTGRVVVVLR